MTASTLLGQLALEEHRPACTSLPPTAMYGVSCSTIEVSTLVMFVSASFCSCARALSSVAPYLQLMLEWCMVSRVVASRQELSRSVQLSSRRRRAFPVIGRSPVIAATTRLHRPSGHSSFKVCCFSECVVFQFRGAAKHTKRRMVCIVKGKVGVGCNGEAG
jgi:hypothetical protein